MPTPTSPTSTRSALQVKTHVKAGGIIEIHNETLVRTTGQTQGRKVTTPVKTGGPPFQGASVPRGLCSSWPIGPQERNHPQGAISMQVKTSAKAGAIAVPNFITYR